MLAGCVNGFLATKARLPAFVATLCMFYIARGIAAWLVAGRQLNQFPESYNLMGRKLIEVLRAMGHQPWRRTASWAALAGALSTQTLVLAVLAVIFAIILWQLALRLHGDGDRRQPARGRLCRHQHRSRAVPRACCSAPCCASLAGLIYVAYFRSFNPSAGTLRELDVIAAAVIGGASIFGGYGSVLGALAGAMVITLMRALLSLQIISSDGSSLRDAAALGQCLHRRHPDHRRARRHLAAAGAHPGALHRHSSPADAGSRRHDGRRNPRSWRCAASARPSAPCRRCRTCRCA